MSALNRVIGVLLVLGATVLVVAGCGSSGSTGSNAGATSAAGGGTTVAGAEIAGLGSVLVDSQGMTVYEFGKDKGASSSCYGACAQEWPPVLAAGRQSAGAGAMSSKLGTTKRKDGTIQVTYAGRPLYTYSGDVEAGEANGNELDFFGGKWSAMNEAGEAVAGTATESSSSESSGGYGY